MIRLGIVSPSEFWRMRPVELHWLIEAKQPAKKYAGGLSEDEVAARYAATYGEDEGDV